MTAFFYNRLIISLMLFLLAACGSDEFSAIKSRGVFNAEELRTAFNQRCSDFSLAKPKVSFLFVWDNSTSRATDTDVKKKNAIDKLITTISGKFDFRILVAPLLGSGNNGTYYLANESVPSGQRPTGSSKINNLYNAANRFQFIQPVQGSKEGGVKRSYELLQSNRSFFHSSTGVMIVVLMSDQNDNSWCSKTWECRNPNHTKAINYKNKYVRKFKNLGKQFETLRFFALVTGKGNIYRNVSEQIQGASSLDTGTSDSYNIEKKGIPRAFEGINKAIKSILLKHKYNFWPVAGPGNGPFDPGTITVTRYTENGQENNIPKCTSGITNNCFFYRPEIYRNQNTRYAPTPGAPYTAHLIELRGPQARVRYPECLRVKTTAYRDYYGYVPLGAKPVKGTIKLEIDGKTIHESASNGWQLITDSTGNPLYKDRQNIKIQQDQNGNPLYRNGAKVLNSQSPLYKSGYLLELFGNAIYTNGSSVRFKFDPSAS